ncbi:MAG: methylenetetrahydrofolate--tRNA-(uracil(54)-C(5))-methyltransferase (FADH(2)-oxidizing) TrmFO [Peptococcaceae bacterium]|jgi:methylenetetrahydrofolate--tRNA-(uracil-5-)-methyltransferase|nr:methylenetetrahydrofolate--tRNA-(uracil(54)-C(5))-methyltransferase (FADH(2)-oxidizing) TrmFO [Peptococcaceae bacterium]
MTDATNTRRVAVIGAGLAGSEAAWQLARRGAPVTLYEMRPLVPSPAHRTDDFAELVCSNSLRADNLENAVGLLKEEMRRLDSLIIACADACRVPAGGALAVDRQGFARLVTERLLACPLVEVVRREITALPATGVTVLATGPLTSPALTAALADQAGLGAGDTLYFYDAAAPLVTADSLTEAKGFWASRYDKGEADYFNCPMTKEEYDLFYQALTAAPVTPARAFEREKFFEGCMPVEALAARGYKTLLFGPLKPVGLSDPQTGRRPYAVVQLRQDDRARTLLNMVGFQTRLTRPAQNQVFRLIPALAEAEFARYGMVHRNTFLNAPRLLRRDGRLAAWPNVFPAGQMTGVEGYVESAASGLIAGINAYRAWQGRESLIFPPTTALGGLSHYLIAANPASFQPMNINFGLLPALAAPPREKKSKNALLAARALAALADFRAGEPDLRQGSD